MVNGWKWLATGAVILAISVWGGIGLRKADPAEAGFAGLSDRERNLAVFDAACGLIEEKYFDRKFAALPEWKQQKIYWRERAATEAPLLLYTNVLANLVRSIPNSHFQFVRPAPASKVSPKPVPKSGSRPISADELARMERNAKAFLSSPGFSAPEIRRGNYYQSVVDEVIPGSAAERAGISPGWLVLNTNRTLTNKDVVFSARFLRLDPEQARHFDGNAFLPGVESPSQWSAYREAHAYSLEFEMKEIEPATAFETRQLPGGVTYLRFDSFVPAWIGGGGLPDRAMDVIEAAGPGGLILDLRRNTGGREFELDRIAGQLLGSEALIGYQNRSDGTTVRMDALHIGAPYQGPLVVLIGPSSMSAAEIIAAAIQDQKRGKLIGRATSGSVVIGNKFELPDGGTMMVPVGDFQRIDERRIENVGVHPDIWILPTLEDVRAGRDPVFERAVQEIRAMSEPPQSRRSGSTTAAMSRSW